MFILNKGINMENYSNIVCNAMNRCEKIYYDDMTSYKGFSQIYPFTTENIKGYINHFDLGINKSLLTVGSSGDQVINAVLKGCRDITVIDINPYTKFYYYLKMAAIIDLTYDEYFMFFKYKSYPTTFEENEDTLCKNLYDRLKDNLRLLDYESYLFWEEILLNYNNVLIRNRLFSNDEGQIKENRGCNNYLSTKEDYLKTRTMIKKVHPVFINDDILTVKFNRRFDVIWLSNIANYLNEDEIKDMVHRMYNRLNINGQMLISYLYKTKKDTKYQKIWPIIYNLENTKKLLYEFDIEQIMFQSTKGIIFDNKSMSSDSMIDSIIMCKKR